MGILFSLVKVFLFTLLLAGVLFLGMYFELFSAKAEVTAPPADALYLDASQAIEDRVANLLSYMSLEEKIGQMALVEKSSLKNLEDLDTYKLGALLSGSGSKPEENIPAGWKEMIHTFQTQAKATRLGIPLLYGSDAIHGHAHVEGATIFPHALGLGASGNFDLVKDIASATRKELSLTGVNWNFAPNLDQPRDIRWGRVYEAFSDDAQLVSKLGVASVEGLQENSADSQVPMLATLKHYIGVGSMGWGTSYNENYKIDQGVTKPEEDQLYAQYLPPYKAAIDAGALSVLVGLNSWGNKKMVQQKPLIEDVLKDELGFKGFVVSDWYGVHEGRRNIFWATVTAVNSGVDMLMLPFDYQTFSRHLKIANRLGLVTDERIDDAVSRILYAKFAMGLFDYRQESVESKSISIVDHKALAREAVAQSMVLLKNEGDILPIKNRTQHIRVAGSAADNIGRQLGAWSIEWQGVDGVALAGATSILEGIAARAPAGSTVEYEIAGGFATSTKKADIGIAVVGEGPYAEGWGDTPYPVLGEEDLLAIKNLQASSEKVVVILVSGRPLLIANEIEGWDALIAAWLPGSEGAGIADVLFGDKAFTGTLPLPWPKTAEQLPLTAQGDTADGSPVLFPRYFGL